MHRNPQTLRERLSGMQRLWQATYGMQGSWLSSMAKQAKTECTAGCTYISKTAYSVCRLAKLPLVPQELGMVPSRPGLLPRYREPSLGKEPGAAQLAGRVPAEIQGRIVSQPLEHKNERSQLKRAKA